VKTYRSKIEARIEGNAYGMGYTSTHGSMNTDLKGYVITNSATVYYGDSGFNQRASFSIGITPLQGSYLDLENHGSGIHKSKEMIKYA
jgi:hypothetical protein